MRGRHIDASLSQFPVVELVMGFLGWTRATIWTPPACSAQSCSRGRSEQNGAGSSVVCLPGHLFPPESNQDHSTHSKYLLVKQREFQASVTQWEGGEAEGGI